MPWDDNNVAKLRDLWDQGLPTAQIGKLLGFTKNAVVGKAHRIGLERRPVSYTHLTLPTTHCV